MAHPYIREFGLQQPPLIQQLRKILYDYQDDALLKEIIQNADDAGATEIKIVYDGRRINKICDERFPFRKFFQGPGLCVYNNEIFTEKDWDGVTKINSSVKENDLLKVGRFGLGFKSVFHLTDNVCIISDNRILLIDPFQEEKGRKVCASISLSDVQNCQLFSVEDILLALNGMFGMSKSVFDDGKYPGTIFWFSLRESPSALSDTIYDQHKIESLFKSLQIESTNNLLFLKYLERLEIYIRRTKMNSTCLPGDEAVVNVDGEISDGTIESTESIYARTVVSEGPVLDLVFKLEVVDDKTMLEKRRNFLKHIEKLDEHANSDVVCYYNISFNASVKRPGGTAFDTHAETWIVLNLFKVTDMSPSLANLTKMSSLSYRPYVSVATPLKPENMPFKGHVFCFLPLPQEPKSITGLPVHLNAFFALSQNRRQIKWPSVEQEECGMYTDRDLVWNQLLLSELLPYAYALLLRRIVSYSEENVGLKGIVHTLYRSIPDVDMVERRLLKLAKCLFSFIVNDKIFFTANNGGRWISHSKAIFTNTTDSFLEDNAPIARSVVNILVTYKQNYVQLPEHVQRSLSDVMKFKYFEPEDLSRLLLKNEQYKRLLPGDKLNLLTYFLSHESYIFLKDIELLPLRDGSFTIFSSDLRKISPVYILDEDTMDLFPGLESTFVLPSISSTMKEHFKVIMKSEYFQVSLLTLETVACLIEHSIRLNARSYEEKVKASGICLGESWIQKVWKFILTQNCIWLFENIPVVPKCEKENSEMELLRLTDKLIVKDFPGIFHPLPQGVCDALGHLSVTVLTSFPNWLSFDALKMYIFFPESSSFFKLLDRLHTELQRKDNSAVLDDFNKNCPIEARKELVKYLVKLGDSSWTFNIKNLVRRLQLFRESYNCQNNYNEDYSLVSLSENDKITQNKTVPIRLPYRVIVATPDEAKLALHIGVHELNPVRINIDILKNIEQGHYSKGEVNIFLLFLFDNFDLYQNDKDIVQYLKSIPFLKSRMNSSDCRVGDLFDPTPSHLQQLFLMEDKFPKTFCEEPYISILKKLGLKVDVTFVDLIETAKSLHHLSVAKNLKEIVNVKAKAFMQILETKTRESYGSAESILSSLKTLKCILWMKHKPNGFPKMLPWLKVDTTLFKPTEVLSDKHIHLVGSVVPLVDCINYMFLAKLFQWGQRPPLETVLKQLETIITTYEFHNAEEAYAGLLEIYTYVNEMVVHDTNSKHKVRYLQNWRCLLVNSNLMKPSEVVRHLEHNCSPYIYSLDQTEVCKYTHFLDAVGVKEHCDSKDVINALKRMRESKTKQTGPSTRLIAVDLQLSINLLMSLKDTMVAENVTFENLDACLKSELYAPDTDSILRHTSDLCLNDLDGGPDANVYFVHKMVSQDLATHIGIQTRRTRIYESNSIGIEFGQEEELVTRINNLLSSYPCDTGIMKELLQNADDAGATEVHFVKDYRFHSCTRVFEEKCTPIQGPALCVYSDSSFTEEDIKGIQKLGLGSKRYDASKIGQYGIGFNSVYHITDIPSFVTKDPHHYSGGILCIFDPLCKYVPQATKRKPGRMFTIKDIQTYYPDILLAYDIDLLKSERATMFRFPLRTAEMARVSKITNQEMTVQQMDETLTNFRTEMAECLLFLKNVTKVTIENITSGTRDIEYYVDISLSRKDHAERKFFAKHIEEFVRQEKLSFMMKPRQVEYTLTIKDSCGMDNSYYVVQRIGFGFSENDVPDILKEAVNNGMLYNLPIGGVALPQNIEKGWTYGGKVTGTQCPTLNNSDTDKVYCFLPLAIKTGLPFHINGHFVLDQGSRRCLWNEMSGFRKMFNETVLERTVAPAYVTALEHMKSILCEVESNIEDSKLHEMLDKFHKLFPILSSAKEDYWKFLVKMVYRTIKKEKHEVFVVVIPEHLRGHESLRVKVKWVSLANDESFNPPCFNDLSKWSRRNCQKLTILLKRLGLKLLDTPLYIYDSMQNDVRATRIKPRIVSEFLRSYKTVSSERCEIANVSVISLEIAGIDVKKTYIESVSNANLLLTYLKKMKPFHLDGLPLLVTEDEFLREFSKSRPVFISKYCNLFQNSGDTFVHHLQLEGEVSVSRPNPEANSEECLAGIFPHITVHEMSPSNVFKVIRPADLHNLLTLSLDSIFHSGETVPWNKGLLSEEWIERFWHMICEMSSAIKEGGRPDVDNDLFCKLIAILGNFSLLPIQCNDQCSYLLPINKGYQIVDISSFQIGSDLQNALEKITFLRLDSNALSNKLDSGTKFDVVSAMRYLMSSAKRPGEVLKFLKDSKNNLICLSDNECRSLLTFISVNWEEKSNSKRFQEICNLLFVLPLFSTYDGKRVALQNEKTALLVYPQTFIPPDGITEWTARTSHCILEGHKCVFEICRRLQSVQIIDVFSLYHQYIIETFEHIPHGHRIKHLEYIRDDLLKKAPGSKYSQFQWRLITKLKATACLPVNQELRKVTDFCNPENEIFKLFCRDHEILPTEYSSKKWLPFLVTCGLNNTVRDDDLIKFAVQMEHHICASPPMDIERKSQVLVREFLRRMSKNDLISNTRMEETIWSRETKSKISKIKFIIPYTVSEFYSSIHIQHKAESTLISFSGAVSSKHKNSCWTTMSLLPKWACPRETDSYKELGIALDPPQEAVVQHLINICHSGSANMISTELMDTMYGCLDAFGDLRSHRERLSEARIIHIPDESIFVKTNQVFLESNIPDLRPYMFKAPIEYGKYHNTLFRKLCIQEGPSFHNFLKIFQQMKDEGFEVSILERIVHTMMILKPSYTEVNDVLYLPNRKKALVNSRDLIISDNKYLEKRLGDEHNFQFFIELQDLGIHFQSIKCFLDCLPVDLRPLLLSKIVREQVDEEEIVITISKTADRIKEHIHSQEFLRGILRLANHVRRNQGSELSELESIEMVRNIQNTSIVAVKGLKSRLLFNDEILPNTEEEKLCFYKKKNGYGYMLYMLADIAEAGLYSVLAENGGLTNLIDQCTNDILKNNFQYIHALFDNIDMPQKIHRNLDRFRIESYEMTESIATMMLPRTGTYLSKNMLPFLNQGLTIFSANESVPVVLEVCDPVLEITVDDVSGAGEPRYIYCRVLSQLASATFEGLPGSEEYAVDIDGLDKRPLTVPGFKLFKILPDCRQSILDDWKTLDPHTLEMRILTLLNQIWNLTETDRRRVIKRLWLHWDPRNQDEEEEFACEMRMSLEEKLLNDDEDELLEDSSIRNAKYDNDNEATRRWFKLFKTLESGVPRQASDYNIVWTNQLQNRGQPIHDRERGLMWLHQAKTDQMAAEIFFPMAGEVGEGCSTYHWICYMCHQGAEKALKAAWYFKDAREAGSHGHQLSGFAGDLGSDIETVVRKMENSLGHHTRMRYPSDSGTMIPAKDPAYSKNKAELAIQDAKTIINYVESKFENMSENDEDTLLELA